MPSHCGDLRARFNLGSVTPTNLSRIYIRIHIQDGLFALINSEPEKEDLDLAKNIKAAKVMRVAHLPCPLRRL